jgi:hypothetical protein
MLTAATGRASKLMVGAGVGIVEDERFRPAVRVRVRSGRVYTRCSPLGRTMAAVPAGFRLPHPHPAYRRVPPYTPLQVFFLTRLAHLVALCYHARHESAAGPHSELLRHALRSTIDDCFDAGLAPELLALLAEESPEA